MSVSNNDIIRVNVEYTMANTSKVLNVFTFLYAGSLAEDADALSDIAAWVVGTWGDLWKDFASGEANLTSLEADVLLPNGHVDHNLGAVEVDIDGALSGETNSSAFSGLFTCYTAIPKTRGSKYVPGAARDGVADNAIQSVLLAALAALAEAAVTAFVGGITDGVFVPGVLSRVSEEFVSFNGSFLTTDEPSYQRRRKRSRGA